MPQALKPLCPVHFWSCVNSLFSLLALWGNKELALPTIKVKSSENFRQKLAQKAANGPVWMPQALKPFGLIHFWVNPFFSFSASGVIRNCKLRKIWKWNRRAECGESLASTIILRGFANKFLNVSYTAMRTWVQCFPLLLLSQNNTALMMKTVYRDRLKCFYVVARSLFLLLLTSSAWLCLGPA